MYCGPDTKWQTNYSTCETDKCGKMQKKEDEINTKYIYQVCLNNPSLTNVFDIVEQWYCSVEILIGEFIYVTLDLKNINELYHEVPRALMLVFNHLLNNRVFAGSISWDSYTGQLCLHALLFRRAFAIIRTPKK